MPKITMRSFALKTELPVNLNEFVSLTQEELSDLFVIVCFVFIPSEAISVSYIEKLRIRVPCVNSLSIFSLRRFL